MIVCWVGGLLDPRPVAADCTAFLSKGSAEVLDMFRGCERGSIFSLGGGILRVVPAAELLCCWLPRRLKNDCPEPILRRGQFFSWFSSCLLDLDGISHPLHVKVLFILDILLDWFDSILYTILYLHIYSTFTPRVIMNVDEGMRLSVFCGDWAQALLNFTLMPPLASVYEL